MQLKKFILRFGLTILLPILILGSAFEITFRHIPNTHRYKKEYMDKHAGEIEVLILGNSHAFDGANPAYIDFPAFNLAYHAQEFIYDLLLTEKYISHMKSLKCLVFAMSYQTLFEEDVHRWRANKYRLYYGIDNEVQLSHKLECFRHENFGLLADYLLKGKDMIVCDSLGSANVYDIVNGYNWESAGISAARRHTLYKGGQVKNLYILQKLDEFSRKNNLKMVFITFPGWKSYYEHFDQTQWETMQNTIGSFVKNNPNLYYYNFINDTTFTQNDFMNVDHLNQQGAAKMSAKLNCLLHEIIE